MLEPYRTLRHNQRRIVAITKLDLIGRYVSSMLGMAWLFIFPLIFLSIYAYTYLLIFQVSSTQFDTPTYVLVIFGALIPFISFQESFQASASAMIAGREYLHNTLFPAEILPVRAVLASVPILLAGFAILLVGILFYARLHATLVLLPIAIALQIVFMIGLAWLASTITVFFRDFQQMVGLLSILFMVLSPIGYTREQIPPHIALYAKLNPLYYMIEFYRDILFRGTIDAATAVIWVVLAFGFFHAGYFVFSRLRPVFTDYV